MPSCSTTFAGVDPATLQAWLAEAQTVLHALTVGKQAQVVAYTQGDGAKSVTYTPADVGKLNEHIRELNAALSGTRRRAVGVRF